MHALLSLHVTVAPLQVPPAHRSGPVQALLSLQATVLAVCVQPVVALQASVVHSWPSLQFNALPAAQIPLWQLSETVHTLPSASQPVPLTTALKTQAPFAGLQLSVVQLLPSLQIAATPGLQAPLAHASPCVQPLPSLQAALLLVCVQPVTALHASLVHGFPSSQLSAPLATQLVPWQLSLGVQTLLSALQAAPVFWAVSAHVPVVAVQVFFAHAVSPLPSQVTIVAAFTTQVWLLSWQINVPSQKLPFSSGAQSLVFWHWHVLAPLTQAPAAQTSPCVQALPSSQTAVLFACVQPLAGLHASFVQGLLSSHVVAALMAVPAHVPPPQTSFCVHALPSSQPSALLLNTQPLTALQESLVQTLLSTHTMPTPLHWPLAQVSPFVQALPSEHVAVLNAWRQPEPASHVSSVQGLPSPHAVATLTAVPEQTPLPQMSPVVQRLLSLHAMVLLTCVQPIALSHASLVQALPSSHAMGAPAHLPMLQTSPAVQALPSSQLPPALKLLHAPVVRSQESDVHALLSLHVLAVPARHALAAQTSPTVHGLLSLHGLLLAVWTQPLIGSQVSSVHGLPSSQPMPTPGMHAPEIHWSPLVQTELSALHAAPSFVATMPH